ncbi:MAG: DegT/DnrJ/EryC1/StrS family aminotransferase, partial [Desulfuromonadales bacterium]
AVYYPIPLHRQDVFAEAYSGVTLPIAERVAEHCLSLPVYPEMPEESVRLVARIIREVLN